MPTFIQKSPESLQIHHDNHGTENFHTLYESEVK